MKNYIQPGNTITWTNPGQTAVASGSVVAIGNILGVAAVTIPASGSGEVATAGVFECPKVSGAVIAQGEGVIWDASESAFEDSAATPATGDVSGAAVAWAAAGNGVLTVRVRLGNVGTVA